MKYSSVSSTLVLALATSAYAAPASFSDNTGLSKREQDAVADLKAQLDLFAAKRLTITDPVELKAREYTIVTQILAAINQTGLAPKIIEGLVDNKTLQPLITDAVVAIIKSGAISLKTLFTALNDSGLAVRVIKDLINDCQFYETIFKVALTVISDLLDKIKEKNAGGNPNIKRWLEEEDDWEPLPARVKRYDDNGVVNNLLESLANSGLALSVVQALLTDPQFLQYGAQLIKTLYQDGLINFAGIISAIIDSGLLSSLFKEFFNIDTLKTIIFNALSALAGKCGASTITGLASFTTQKTSTTSLPSFTATQTSALVTGGTSNCKKRRKRLYNY